MLEMGKNKIAIVTNKMIMGGVERALISMLKRFDYEEVEVDLYVISGGGNYSEQYQMKYV